MVTARRHTVDTARVSGFPVLDRPGLDYLQASPKKKESESAVNTARDVEAL